MLQKNLAIFSIIWEPLSSDRSDRNDHRRDNDRWDRR